MKTYLLLQQLSEPKQMSRGAQGVCRDLIYLVINGNRETNQHMLPAESFALRFPAADGEPGMTGLGERRVGLGQGSVPIAVPLTEPSVI